MSENYCLICDGHNHQSKDCPNKKPETGLEAFASVCCYEHASEARRMSFYIFCSDCGNKRCPKATNCANKCTRSNEPNQEASRYNFKGEVK